MGTELLAAAVRAWADTARASSAEDDATSELLNALIAYDAAPEPRGFWAVILWEGSDDDPYHFTLNGMFASKEDAQAYIEEAHDPDDDPCNPEIHIDINDAYNAQVVYVNNVQRTEPDTGVFVLGDGVITP